MEHLKYRSVFDIIGPVMVGPSSSHTAGAARIGKIVRTIFGEQPESVDIFLFESFAKTYRGHGTDIALVGGLLGMEPDDERLSDIDTGNDNKGDNNKEEPEDNTIAEGPLPQTGIRNTIIVVTIVALSVVGVICYIKYKKLKI